MRASAVSRLAVGAARAAARGPCTEAPVELAAVANGVQLQQERFFSAPMFRSRASSSSPWQLERHTGTAHLTSAASGLAATTAWQASVVNAESSQVEDWLAALHMIDAEARGLCTDLLARHPTLLWKDPQRTAGVVQALVDATRARELLRPYATQDAHVLALIDRYTPETLRARLSELHRLVWQKLDEENVAALFKSRIALDVLDLDAKALALKAQALRVLVPEFLPSTVLRACPELLDVQVDDLPGCVVRAGNVIIVGKGVSAELVGANNVVIVRSKTVAATTMPSTLAPAMNAAASAGAATAGRLLRTARCGAQQLLNERARSMAGGDAQREVVRVFCNSRQLVYVSGESMEIRVEDPDKVQEKLSAACRMAVLQCLPVAAGMVNAAGVRA
ncbi:hypothetical protein GPECTOR_1g120 [Gonium pectorale]|uniref:Uncharacterized protein n=1 Tax=Gonium pectorale TaxID=33097 RepID=A0A150H2E0_GONPE|nr:hypothetical protein GPECTOR_1g120 [Gonium pectorale]|eukprot:KXZ56142.1 hypothetical protein GPECTOR_1g120 [Gonium pectorale]